MIETEAQRLVGRLPESQRRVLQDELIDRCEAHWHALRGPQPDTPLAQALWSVTPPLADLLLDLHAVGDVRLAELLPGSKLAGGLALLVLAEVERGNEEGVHVAHEPMMAFETVPPSTEWLERVGALLRGTLEPPRLHPHDKHHDAMWKALAVIAAHSRRLDLPAVLAVIRLLTAPPAIADAALEELRDAVAEVGIRFLKIDDDHVHFEQHGHPHKPVRARRLGEMLLEIRQLWLG